MSVRRARSSPRAFHGDSHLLSALVSGREGEEFGVDGVYAETAHHFEYDGQKPDAMAGCHDSARLVFKTVADPRMECIFGQGGETLVAGVTVVSVRCGGWLGIGWMSEDDSGIDGSRFTWGNFLAGGLSELSRKAKVSN